MEMTISEAAEGVKQIALVGRLDMPGVSRIETQFLAAIVPGGQSVIVDLSKVDFITSLGIRMILSAARSLQNRRAKLALYAPQDFVEEVLTTLQVQDMVPVCKDASAAIAAVKA